MTTYYKRISDNDLKGDFVDGSVLLHTDINEIENLTKAGINANYEDIQKLRDGTISVANATSLSGATLSTSVETLQDDDTKVPTSKQVKEYVDNSAIDDYNDLNNKPSINGVTLVGNKTTEDLGLTIDYEDLENKPTINGTTIIGDLTTEDLGFIPTYYWDGTNTPENVAMFNEVCDKYTNNEPFALYGRLLLNDSWTWEGEEHYRDIAVVVPISVKNYTDREMEGSTAFSFMTDAVRMGGGYAVGSINLTGTWGNFTAVSPITWSFADGPALKKTTVSVSEQIPPATMGNLNTVFQYVGESTEDFTKGYFYICVSDGEEEPTYSWVRINTQPGGGGGSSDYNDLDNKPQINGITLSGNKSFEDLGINPSEQFDTMPTASADYEDKIVQYSGDTTGSYTNGYFYKCVSDGETPATYSWEQINVQNGGSSNTQILGLLSDYKSSDTALDLGTLQEGIEYSIRYDNHSFGGSSLYLKLKVGDNLKTCNINYMTYYIDYLQFAKLYIIKNKDLENNDVVAIVSYNFIGSNGDYIEYWFEIKNTSSTSSLTVNAYNSRQIGIVKKDTEQTITGKKTFSVLPESSVVPTTDSQLVNKKYVDDHSGGGGGSVPYYQITSTNQSRVDSSITDLKNIVDYIVKNNTIPFVEFKYSSTNFRSLLSNYTISAQTNYALIILYFTPNMHYTSTNSFGFKTRTLYMSQLNLYISRTDYDNKNVTNVYNSTSLSTQTFDMSKTQLGSIIEFGSGNPLTTANTSSYTPTSDYNPATKKYVDDNTKVVKYIDDLNTIQDLNVRITDRQYATVIQGTMGLIFDFAIPGVSDDDIIIPFVQPSVHIIKDGKHVTLTSVGASDDTTQLEITNYAVVPRTDEMGFTIGAKIQVTVGGTTQPTALGASVSCAVCYGMFN